MLTGQSDGSRPITDLGVLGFGLAFWGLTGMCAAWLHGLQQSVLKNIKGAHLVELLQLTGRRGLSS